MVPGNGEQLRRKSYDLAADSPSKSTPLALLLSRLNLSAMKKTEAARAAAGGSSSTTTTPSISTKAFKKAASKSPSLPRKPDVGAKGEMTATGNMATSSGSGGVGAGGALGGVNRAYSSSSNLHPVLGADDTASVTVSVEDLDTADGSSGRENGGSDSISTTVTEDFMDGQELGDSQKVRAAIDHLQTKMTKTKELIRREQNQKESNVNEYLRLAASADKQQSQRIKTLFEKRNQKSAQSINHLQKKLEQYQKRLQEIEVHGVTGHKQAKEVLRDVGQGLNTIVSKPKEFAHLIKNRFGSADNIAQMKIDEAIADTETQQPTRSGGTLPANFKYGSDEDNSSVTSGSGFGGVQTSPLSASQNAPQSIGVVAQVNLEPLYTEVYGMRESSHRVEESVTRLAEEFESYKSVTQSEMSLLRSLLDEEKFKVDRLEEQINDLTELHQNEMANLKQDMTSMEEKIEYRLDERTTDLSDLVDSCQTRIHRLEQQQQQQQLLSMEMVENVTFRTILTKLINVVLAILAVFLVFLSTGANLVAPFLTSRMRIISTGVAVLVLSILWTYSSTLVASFVYVWDSIASILPGR